MSPARIVEPTKVCASCQMRKPYSEFHRAKKNSEARGPRCKPCDREHQRQWRAQHHDRVLEHRRADYQRVKADPDRYAARLEAGRNSQRRARGTKPENYRRSAYMRRQDARLRQRDATVRLPAGPFIAWLLDVVVRDGVTKADAVRRVGLARRQFDRIISGEVANVELEVVERALIADGAHLRDVYPKLYEEATC